MLGALVVAAAVVAAPGQARLVPPVGGVVAGKPATASVLVTGRRPRALPRVRFVLDGTIVTATARAATSHGRYTLRFTLPFGGSWSHQIRIAGRVAGSGHTVALVESHLPGADARPICGEAGAFWPTETLAIDFGTPWIACKGSGSLLRLEPRKRIRFGGSAVIAVATGFGSVWALDGSRSGTLIRIDPATNAVLTRIDVGAAAAYNLWGGAGSMWVAGDRGAEIVRIDPETNAVVAHVAVGDGPADLAFDHSSVYVIDHRDRTLFRIDPRTNAARLIATIPGDAPERIVFVDGHLWITGRGTDLLEIDPANGDVLRTVEIGAGGIDVVASGDTLWVPSRNAQVDARGFPTMEALRRVDARTGAVTSLAASAPLDVHGLVADDGGVWLADNTHGVLYRVAR